MAAEYRSLRPKLRWPNGILYVATVFLLAGCSYLPDRLRDLADVGRVSVGPCLGLGVDVKATGLLHPSIGLESSGIKVGWDTRDCLIFWKEKEA